MARNSVTGLLALDSATFGNLKMLPDKRAFSAQRTDRQVFVESPLQTSTMELTLPSHNSLLGDLSELDTWLAGIGVPARPSDRIHHLIELLRELKPPGLALTITREEQRQYMYALAELVEFHQIFTWLRQDNPAVLRPKLTRSLSGSLDPADESATNNRPQHDFRTFPGVGMAESRTRGRDRRA